MDKRKCTKCGETKVFNETKDSAFTMYTDRKGNRKAYSICKKCKALAAKERCYVDIEKSRAKNREKYYASHEKSLARAKRYRETHKDRVKECRKSWYSEKGLEWSRSYREKEGVREKQRTSAAKYRVSNPEKYAESQRKHRAKRKQSDKYRTWKREYQRDKRASDPMYRIKMSIRNRIAKSIVRHTESSLDLLGCSMDHYKRYLENKFSEEMSWDNYGDVWHIDHIIPCNYFDLTDKEQIRLCFNYLNTQPLSVSENCSKRDAVPENLNEIISTIKSALNPSCQKAMKPPQLPPRRC